MNQKQQEPSGHGNTSLAVLAHGLVEQVTKRVTELIAAEELHLPKDYSAPNALKSARLILESVVDKDKNPALKVCTHDSIAHALLTMVVLGLNPAKTQCYFVVYGKTLVCLRSAKMGSIALVKRVLGGQAEVWDEVVYADDDFEYEITGGRKVVTKHIQKLANIDLKKIVAAYAVLEPGEDKDSRTEIMTIDQIRKAWNQGAAKGKSKAHENFTDEMCRKTVVNRLCKPVISSSDDSYLVRVFKEQEVMFAAAESEAVAELEANATTLDFADEQISPRTVDVTPIQEGPRQTVPIEDLEDEETRPSPPSIAPTGPRSQPTERDKPEPTEPLDSPPEDESVVPSPKTLFDNFVDEQDMDASMARKVAASIVRLDDARKLSNADYVDVLADISLFTKEYEAFKSKNAQPVLNGTD